MAVIWLPVGTTRGDVFYFRSPMEIQKISPDGDVLVDIQFPWEYLDRQRVSDIMSKSWIKKSPKDEDAPGIEHIDGLYGYALILTRNRSDAEDLVQETYVRAISALGRLRANSNLKSWLFTILRNVWLNQLRQKRTTPELVDIDTNDKTADLVVDPSRDPYECYESKVESERVREAIRQLPVEFREIILLREFEELSYQELASVLGCPAGTVMSRLGRARVKLRTLLSNALESPLIPERRTSSETL